MQIDISQGIIEEILVVDAQIPEFAVKTPAEKLAGRLMGRVHLLLVAKDNGEPVGYKLGYALSDSEFYSWHGAILPAYRKQGIATRLRKTQEEWVRKNGFKTISVKSMNRFPAMLQLLISSGYKISGYIDEGDTSNSKILFSKRL